uniref:DNA ligase n=1 Tax=Globisporangium ultimum (strain ATCC 200006 / CBS 805.95 / DAOM BR144) TaxID=431595 RepID=K3WBD5_GLOUD
MDEDKATMAKAQDAQVAAMKLSFAGCCRMLDAVEKTPKSDAKLRLVFSDALRQELGGGGDMYPLLRLLLPQLDRERTYNLKEKKIAKIYIDVLGMASESKDAQKIEHFNDPTVVQSKAVGDFAAVLYDILVYRSLAGNKKYQHTVGVVNELLDQLVKADDNAAHKKVFMRLATEFPANEQKWIVRIVLKDLKIGLRHERVLNFIHPDAMEMYNHTSDLHKVCVDLRNSSVRYVPKIEPFQVFSPMLAKRVDFGECTTAINADVFAMEPKLDGERITCHVQGNRVEFISRNGINYTDNYGPFMAPYVLSQVVPGVNCIFDGEMMVWDNLEYRFREFGLLKNVANALRSGENTSRWLCYVVWDVVYLGGGEKAEQLIHEVYKGPGEVSAVMGLPQYARRQLLERLLKPLDHRITIIEQTLVNSQSAKERHELVMAEVDKQVSNGGEGVILKDINSHYMCGESSRKTKKWIKLKPDYAGMTTNLDVLIIGGFYGTGRRRSGDVSVFLLGVLSRSLDEAAAEEAVKLGEPCPVVYTFAKVGTGYNLEELEDLRRDLEPHWQLWDNDNIPAHLNGWKPQKSDLKPDVWIDPRHSKILEVYGFELTFTTLYQTGLTIRFPRCKAIRNDKPWYQCMNVQDLNTARGSIFNKRAADVALGQKKATKRITKRLTSSSRQPVGGIVAHFSQAKLDNVELKHDVFEGKEFCVLPGKYEKPVDFEIPSEIMGEHERNLFKQAVEKLLHSYGATIVQNPIAETTNFVVAVSDAGFKVANLVKQGRFNIVYLHWVVGCMASSRLLPLKARDFVFATESTRALLAKEYDQFGDHFTEYVKPDDLRLIFKEVARVKGISASMKFHADPVEHWQTKIKALAAEEEEAMECEFTVLAHCVVYVDRYVEIHAARECLPSTNTAERTATSPVELDPFGHMKLLEQQIRLFGATVVCKIDADVTHVVLNSASDRERIGKLQPIVRSLRRLHPKEPAPVSKEWAEECAKQRTQLPVDDFFIPV